MDIKAMLKWGKIALIIFLLNFLLSLITLGLLLWLILKPEKKIDQAEIHLHRAGIYSANALWKLAAEEYQKAAEHSEGTKAISLWLQAGDVCYEKLSDYSCAVESYLNAKLLGKDFSKDAESGSRLVDSLKKLGKEDSANALLNEMTALVPESSAGSTVVARIGERQITMAELRKALSAEPEPVQREFSGADGLRKYLDQYLFTRLLYQCAVDENLLDETARAELERIKERYFAEIYFRKKIMSEAKITEQEIRDYYAQNQAEFKDSSGRVKPLDDVRKVIESKLMDKKVNELRADWFKTQAQKRGLYINAEAFGSK